MTQFVDYYKILFGNVTVDWFITYKFNKITTLDSFSLIDTFHRKSVITM